MEITEITKKTFQALKARASSAVLDKGKVRIGPDHYYNVHFLIQKKGVTIHLGEAKAKYIPADKTGELNYDKIAERIIAMDASAREISSYYEKAHKDRESAKEKADKLNEQFKDVAYIVSSIHNDGTYQVHLKDLGGKLTKEKVIAFLTKYKKRMKD